MSIGAVHSTEITPDKAPSPATIRIGRSLSGCFNRYASRPTSYTVSRLTCVNICRPTMDVVPRYKPGTPVSRNRMITTDGKKRSSVLYRPANASPCFSRMYPNAWMAPFSFGLACVVSLIICVIIVSIGAPISSVSRMAAIEPANMVWPSEWWPRSSTCRLLTMASVAANLGGEDVKGEFN